MSKKYIGYEEPIYEKLPKKPQPPQQEQGNVNVAPVREEGNRFLCALGAIGGTVIRICAFMIITIILLLFSFSTKHIELDIMIGSLMLLYWLSATFYWFENRISAWMINHYMKTGEYRKIWGNDMLHNYIVKYREEFVFNQHQIDRELVLGLDLANTLEVPSIPITWAHKPEGHEISYMTKKFLGSMFFFGLNREFYHLSKSVRSYSWNIIYSIVLTAVICFDVYVAFVCDWALLIRIIGGLYLALHLTVVIPRFVLTWMKESYGIAYMEHDSYPDNREKYEQIHGHKFFWFMMGEPTLLYFPRDRRLENGGHGNGYTWKAYDTKAPFRFFIRLLRLIIIA